MNFQELVKKTVKEYTSRKVEKPKIKKEFEDMRYMVQSQLNRIDSRLLPSASVKNFKFGLNSVQQTQQQAPVERPTTPEEPQVWRGIAGVAGIKNVAAPRWYPLTDPEEERLEFNSVANFHLSFSKHLELIDNEICYFSDLSPVARYLNNVTAEEENELTLSPADFKRKTSVMPQNVLLPIDKFDIDALKYQDIEDFVLGKFSRQDLADAIKINQQQLVQEEVKEEVQIEIHQEPSIQEEMAERDEEFSPVSSINIQNQLDETPPPSLELDIETRLIQVLDLLRQQRDNPNENTDRKLQLLLEKTTDEMEHSEPGQLKNKLLFQFLLEYKRARDEKITKRVRPYTPERAPTNNQASKFEGQVKTTRMRQGWSTSSKPQFLNHKYAPVKGRKQQQSSPFVSRNYRRPLPKVENNNNNWIGATDNADEFEDTNWESLYKRKNALGISDMSLNLTREPMSSGSERFHLTSDIGENVQKTV